MQEMSSEVHRNVKIMDIVFGQSSVIIVHTRKTRTTVCYSLKDLLSTYQCKGGVCIVLQPRVIQGLYLYKWCSTCASDVPFSCSPLLAKRKE